MVRVGNLLLMTLILGLKMLLRHIHLLACYAFGELRRTALVRAMRCECRHLLDLVETSELVGVAKGLCSAHLGRLDVPPPSNLIFCAVNSVIACESTLQTDFHLSTNQSLNSNY